MQICSNLQAEIPPPQFADFLKSATADILKSADRNPPLFADFFKSATADLPKSAGRNPPSICRFPQICHCRFTEICRQKLPPPVCRFTEICRQKFPPKFADFLKSATADLPKSAGRNPPPGLQISPNLPAARDIYTKDLSPAR